MAFSLPKRSDNQYRGRFAPSPSGFLHFGSLIAALASYLDAKTNHGLWLVRIEDIDPPREKVGASKQILSTLEAYGLHWDETELYQSRQSQFYDQILTELNQKQLSYFCDCTRARIKKIGGIYQGHCRDRNLPENNCATRLVNHYPIIGYHDLIQGQVHCDHALAHEDFTIKRKDGLYAYQLAVVIDDIYQGISHVIRGCDLLEPTARQLTFYKTLNVAPPQFGHFPLAVNSEGYKLSKQNNAPSISTTRPQPSLIAALAFLGQQPLKQLLDADVSEIIKWAVENWSISNIPRQTQIEFS
ncbi:tRNA glutamyl-Q(34) synthetase GluQRS [Thalassotalea atypica]|uniref:tRNA glutamyl-Q(34) synthetase GluQRS n=1 Tax=Thalassotalea atypica TaxID=2054316 RepID=UPI00257234DC|nr:tRNA glutamyl-Q(34) synthetase GluQRS [Thalassotalea atypica]